MLHVLNMIVVPGYYRKQNARVEITSGNWGSRLGPGSMHYDKISGQGGKLDN